MQDYIIIGVKEGVEPTIESLKMDGYGMRTIEDGKRNMLILK